jgi:GNAT superfamily N-acetyltransferase
MADVGLRAMGSGDAERVLAIYQAGLDGGQASFETVAPTWAAFDAGRLPAHRLVAVDADGALLGWIAVSPTSTRAVYAGVVEHSVYVDPAAQGRGVARLLLDGLIARPRRPVCGPSSPASSRRTSPVWRCTGGPASASSAPGNGWAGTTAAGATSSSWNAAARS